MGGSTAVVAAATHGTPERAPLTPFRSLRCCRSTRISVMSRMNELSTSTLGASLISVRMHLDKYVACSLAGRLHGTTSGISSAFSSIPRTLCCAHKLKSFPCSIGWPADWIPSCTRSSCGRSYLQEKLHIWMMVGWIAATCNVKQGVQLYHAASCCDHVTTFQTHVHEKG